VKLAGIIDRLQTSALSRVIAHANHLLIASLQIIHVLGITLFLASLLLICLKLWGLLLKEHSQATLLHEAQQFIWIGVSLTVASGIFMFMGSPRHYLYNPAFTTKMVLLGLALAVQLSLTVGTKREGKTASLYRIGFTVTLLLWLSVAIAGRAIGFV
jgi:uncharacterized protein DUF6644